jgi:hypothetical protein
VITYSTPNSITCEVMPGKVVRLFGEWTLEPKFYLDVPEVAFWEGPLPQKELTPTELTLAVAILLKDAVAKGWVIELPSS